MKPHQAVALALLFPAALLLHAKDKKPVVPAVIGQAKYVFVEAVDGQEFDSNLDPEDRIAIADVRDALDKWKRYVLTNSRSDADLVFLVRKGRAESANLGMSPQQRGQMPGGGQAGGAGQAGVGGQLGGGGQFGGDMGPPDDLLKVCPMNADGRLGGVLWQRSMPNGLNAPKVMLLVQFEEAVDKAYPPQPEAAPVKPAQ